MLAVATLLGVATSCTGVPRDAGPDTGVLSEGGADAGDDAGGAVDADAEPATDAAGDGGGLPCPANGDGTLDPAEVVVAVGTPLTLRANPVGEAVRVDVVGEEEGGTTTWRFEEPVDGERVVEEMATAVEGTWWAESFPRATHAAPMSEEYETLGIYRLRDGEMQLLGYVSSDGEGTLVQYEPPVPILRTPLRAGDTWTASTVGSGRFGWMPFYDLEEYTFTADAQGVVHVPAGRFPVIRLRSEVTQTVGLLQTRRIAYAFMAECWGRVALVASTTGERDLDFTEAADYRRLAFE